MSNRKKLLYQITKNLSVWRYTVEDENKRGLTDINQDAEYLAGDLLNILFDWNLENLNVKDAKNPAIDLGDPNVRVCVQVTSNPRREKIAETLKVFQRNGLQTTYHRLLVLIVGVRKAYEKAFEEIENFDFDPDRDIWDIHRLSREIHQVNDIDKLEKIDFCLRKHLRDAMVLHLPLSTSLGTDGFVGRAMELTQMSDALRKGVKPLVLTGLGGMGKTELANHFGRTYKQGKVYYATFRGSFRNTVMQTLAAGIPGLQDENRPEQEIYRMVMERLWECSESDILIIDNVGRGNEPFEALQDSTYRDLCALDMHLILTTRLRCAGALEVGPLLRSELREIFARHDVQLENADKDALIAAVDGHTMTVDLIARILYESWETIPVQKILDAVRSSKLGDVDSPPVYSDYDRNTDRRQRQIQAHLRALFNLTDITPAERCVLCCAVLLPLEGLKGSFFREALPEHAQHAVDGLVKRGWLRRKGSLLAIHPVVRAVCSEVLQPTNEDCEVFLTNIFEKYYDSKQDDPELMSRMAQMFGSVSLILPEDQAFWSLQAANYWTKLGEFDTALEFQQRILEDWNDDPEIEDYMWATVYNNIAVTYLSLGRFQEALDMLEKAMGLSSEIEDAMFVARMHENIAFCYLKLRDFEKARASLGRLVPLYQDQNEGPGRAWILDYFVGLLDLQADDLEKGLEKLLKAAEMLERHPSADDRELTQLYGEIVVVALSRNDWKLAEEYNGKELSIRTRILKEDHPLLGESYLYRSWVLSHTGDLQEAMRCSQKAVRILEDTRIEGEWLLMICYTCHGMLLSLFSQHEQARHYLELAFEGMKRDPSAEPQWLSLCIHFMGLAHLALGSVDQGLEEMMQALQIRETQTPQDVAAIIQSYNGIGVVLRAAGDNQHALECLQKALDIQERSGGADPFTIGETYLNMLQIYDPLEDSDQVLEAGENAIRIWKECLPADHVNFALVYQPMGMACLAKERTTQALHYLHMAQEILEQTFDHGNVLVLVNDFCLTWVYLYQDDYRAAQQHLRRVMLSGKLDEIRPFFAELDPWDMAAAVDLCVTMQQNGETFDNPFK